MTVWFSLVEVMFAIIAASRLVKGLVKLDASRTWTRCWVVWWTLFDRLGWALAALRADVLTTLYSYRDRRCSLGLIYGEPNCCTRT